MKVTLARIPSNVGYIQSLNWPSLITEHGPQLWNWHTNTAKNSSARTWLSYKICWGSKLVSMVNQCLVLLEAQATK